MNGTLYFIVIGTATLLLLLFPTWFANRLNCKRPTISNGEGNKRRGSEQHGSRFNSRPQNIPLP